MTYRTTRQTRRVIRTGRRVTRDGLTRAQRRALPAANDWRVIGALTCLVAGLCAGLAYAAAGAAATPTAGAVLHIAAVWLGVVALGGAVLGASSAPAVARVMRP